MVAPLDVVLGPATVLQPDVLVRRAGPLPTRRLDTVPLLVMEILSPTTRLYDLGTKRIAYREAGVGAYWVVDPAVPSITGWRWDGDVAGTESADGEEEEFSAGWPFPVTIWPSGLLVAGG